MNTSVEGIIVNNCQYAPIYVIQDPGATQGNTYVLASNNVESPKPVSNNLKSFYENSGNIENGLINTDTGVKLNVVKKKESVLIGNNLKLASFLLPKNENVNKQYVVDNFVLKPTTTTTTTASNPIPINNTLNTVPKIDIDRKIVKLKEVPIINRQKFLPKIKPKENTPTPTRSKHTSVQLIRLGETYHSLNHLSTDQIKMVNQALKMFNDPDKTVPEPTYDPVTNTKYIYKVVSPKDLTVVAKKKILLKDRKHQFTKIHKRIEAEKIVKHTPPEKIVKQVVTKEIPVQKEIVEEEVEPPAEDFGSLYRLQKHYENHPTHIPAKIHSNLFHCLLAIIKSGSDGNKTNIFIQQLEQLIVKLKSLLPCLLSKVEGTDGQPCTINEDIGRLFGMNPGKYNIDVEALNCVKDKNGYCIHNPPKINQLNKDQIKSPHSIKNMDELLNKLENETENCARINSVAKWPTVSKRIWKLKPKTHEQSAKKMRLKSEGDTLIELGTEDFTFPKEEKNNFNAASVIPDNNIETADIIPEDEVAKLLESTKDCEVNSEPGTEQQTDDITTKELSKPKTNYVKFHSTHFDIRSSPIKSSSTVFRKFQINPSKMANYDGQVIRSLEMVNKPNDKDVPLKRSNGLPNTENNTNLQSRENRVHISTNPTLSVRRDLLDPNNSIQLSIPDSLLDSLTNSDSNHVDMSPNNGLRLHSMTDSNGIQHVTVLNSENELDVNMLDSDNDTRLTKPASPDLHDDMSNIIVVGGDTPASHSSNDLHVTIDDTDRRLDVNMPNSNSIQYLVSTTGTSLHDLFKDDVDLSCKDVGVIDPDLKDWIIGTSEKSEDGFSKSSLMEPVLLHSEKSLDSKTLTQCNDMPTLDDSSDNRLLSNQGESVLNFLDTLGNDLYPETEIRNNGVDFQLDLFAFHNS
ncbi:uncharacterized protein LOC118263498 isoform X3 [Spodoptera frugiperda]|uniref:Uncharacterized protein LOC118263498 isoform X3 n=1 Tax=Spodoptera frugiperda TaxID=7108 RepID=A0A9R0EGF3_SPOFR|nr:uncharacterized protein LOC118263498 isoform X3 [Spodoptera frugiperda]